MIEETLIKMHELIESEGNELFKLIQHRIYERRCSSSLELKTILIEKAANEIPCLTMSDLVEATWEPSSLSQFNPLLSKWNIEDLVYMIMDWMQFYVLSDRIQRVQKYLESNEIHNALVELNVQRCFDPYKHPTWLAFEFDQGLQIRPDQATILHHVLSRNGSVTQLNMGLGKTRVIVPCLILELSKRQKIPRVYLLSSLLDEGYDYLHLTLTSSVFAKKLFRFPFSRDVKLSPEQTMLLRASLKYCEDVSGAVVLAPEHSLSLYLKQFEQDAKIPESDSFHFADIFDEVDEVMRPQQEVIYAEGTPKALEFGSRRWFAVFTVLFNIRHNHGIVSFLDTIEIADLESKNAPIDEFNGFRLRPGKLLEKERKCMIEKIAESLFCSGGTSNFNESTLDWMKKPLKSGLQARIVDFITDCSQSSNIICESDFFSPEYYQDLLVLRGLLAHDVLIHCLKLRHGVQYGFVSNHKTLMAIPFEAANLPKLRSEFAQPDISIILTVLSYYNIGLTRDQVIETITELLAVGKSLQRRVYKEIFALCKMTNKKSSEVLSSIDIIEKLDLKNEVQVDLLYILYRKNMIFINFWLGNVIFPTATMIFPKKITASSWNLIDTRKSSLRCGFSGTDDACLLLPYPLAYDPPDAPSLLATNGKMLEHLIIKAKYCSFLALPKAGKASEYVEKPTDCTGLLMDINESIFLAALVDMANEKDASAFIDTGALLCNHPMQKVAMFFLSRLKDKFKGVVYFSVKDCGWRVIDRKPRETNLKSSSITERDAFVIYDQSRCRGADMKLHPNATALLSIGPCQQKDSLLQGAGRLRQLDSGQTIIAIATPNVESLIKDCLGLPKDHSLTMEHVVSYALVNSVNQTGNSLKHWCSQGMRFLRSLNNPSSILEEELSDLESLYAASDKRCTLSQIIVPKLNSIEADYPELNETSAAVLKMLKERIELLGIDVAANCIANFEECERELEQEREKEKEKEEEFLQMHPFNEKDWEYSKIFGLDSPLNIDFIDDPPMSATQFFSSRFLSEHARASCSCIDWHVSKIYLTYNFVRPLVEECPYDNYLRPVRTILFFPLYAELLVVSEREAENLWRCMLLGNVKEQRNTPILCGISFLSLKKSVFSPFRSLISHPCNVMPVSSAALCLLNGQTLFDPKDQEALENDLLQSKEAATAASFFCKHRGFSGMFLGSDLEKSCNNVMQYLHAKGKKRFSKKLDKKIRPRPKAIKNKRVAVKATS